MRSPKNNLSPIKKRALLITITVLIIILSFFFILFLKREKANINEDKIAVTSLKISILNGCGIDGAAKDVKEYLINKNIKNLDIIAWENVERDMFIYGKTLIVIKKDDEEKLKYLMKITGIKRRIFALDPNTIEDMQIILGRDYKNYLK